MLLIFMMLIFFVIVGSTWWFGLWNNVLTLINFFISALVASSFYESVATSLLGNFPSFEYLADFISLWGVFILTFVILRAITDMLSAVRLKFDPATEIAGRSILSIWIGLAFVSFASFSLHLAPLPPDSFQASVSDKNFLVGPDRFWMAFVQSRSRGALSESQDTTLLAPYNRTEHPDDAGKNLRVFDPNADFVFDHHARRAKLSQQQYLRVSQ